MIQVTKGIRPEEVKQSGRHVLFVEGSGSDSFDPQIIGELFGGMIRIEPLGASYSVKSVAEALHAFHPTYYFLIDRDHHHNDDMINDYWENFPDPETHNLLIWKYREIENYFLDPDYLVYSDFLVVGRGALEDRIKVFCQQRLYLDIANYVIVSIREELKRNWIHKFTDPADFSTRDQALVKLHNTDAFDTFRDDVATAIDRDGIERRFDEILNMMTNASEQLEFGNGKWLEMTEGKKVFSQVVNSNCFRVVDLEGNILQGKEKINQVAKNLLRKENAKQPDDFQRLKTLVEDRFSS